MLKFKPLELTDQDIIMAYLKDYPFKTYEYSFITLYLWKKYCHVEYAIFRDALIIKKKEHKKGTYFMQPIGYSDESLPEIIREMRSIQQKERHSEFLLRDIEEPFLQKLKDAGLEITYEEDEKSFDYIYEIQRLIHLNGEKLHKKKNHYNQFVKGYRYEIKDIHHPGVAQDCLEFASAWLDSQKVKYKEIIFEHNGINNILCDLNQLKSVLGMAVYVEEKVAGFTIGEIVNQEMAIIHVEKGDINYKGVYAFLNKTFAELYLNDIPYVNREEDLGMLKLIKAKKSYDPVRLEKKYLVNVKLYND